MSYVISEDTVTFPEGLVGSLWETAPVSAEHTEFTGTHGRHTEANIPTAAAL